MTPTHVTADGRRVVVAAALVHRGRLLAARRTRPASVAGRWELPGGKVEPREDPHHALVRELREELAVDAEVVGAVPGPLDGDWPLSADAVLRVLRARLVRGEPTAGIAHDETRWLGPREADAVPWLDADVAPARAALARLDTWVDFPARAVSGEGVVLRVDPLGDGHHGVVVDRTPFHPLDPGWPDQPGDLGSLAGIPVRDCLTGTVDDHGELAVGAGVGVRRGDASRTWVVVHVVDAAGEVPRPGSTVDLQVDPGTRLRLSRAHSACHLAALALNETTARFWRKEPPRRDSRGEPFLDQLAIVDSQVRPDAAHDAYRVGRTLRKAGFDLGSFLAEAGAVAEEAATLLDAWTGRGGPSRVEVSGDPTLGARRTWVAEVPGGPASIPCGGTHVADLAEIGRIRVSYRPTDEGFAASTSVTPP